MNAGEVVLVDFPFADQVNTKRRPVMVLFDVSPMDVAVCQITSGGADPSAVAITQQDMVSGTLKHSCFVRPHKIATIEKGDVVRPLGRLNKAKYDLVVSSIQARLKY